MLRWSSMYSTQNDVTAIAGVRERHVLEGSDHGVDLGSPLSIAQRHDHLDGATNFNPLKF